MDIAGSGILIKPAGVDSAVNGMYPFGVIDGIPDQMRNGIGYANDCSDARMVVFAQGWSGAFQRKIDTPVNDQRNFHSEFQSEPCEAVRFAGVRIYKCNLLCRRNRFNFQGGFQIKAIAEWKRITRNILLFAPAGKRRVCTGAHHYFNIVFTQIFNEVGNLLFATPP